MNKIYALIASILFSAGSLMAETTVVYLNDGGGNENDGATPETAVSTLTKAYSLIPADHDGVIVVNGKFTQTANFVPTEPRTGTMTITQVYNGVDYREADHNESAWTMNKGLRLGISCPTRFENITFNQTQDGGYLLLIANFHELTIGQGCEMNGGFTWGQIAKSFTVLGGCQDNDKLAPEQMNPKINIESGDVYLVLFNRGTAKNFSRNQEIISSKATVNISGGRVHYIYAGSVSSGLKGGSSEINFTGGELVHRAFLGTTGGNSVDGEKVEVNVTGGTFPAQRVFNISEPQNNPNTSFELNVKGSPLETQYTILHYTLTMDFDKVTSDLLVPEKVFGEGTWPLADGTDMKYRYYVPDETKSGTTHLVLYLHDAGSRGDDNKLHLCSMGASPLYQLINAGEKVIIVAGQVPKEEKWVTGSGGLQEDSEATQWLDGAVALAKKMAQDHGVKPENMYLTGSSNGAAAVWYLLNTETPEFTRAAPIAGYGDVGSKFDTFVANVSKTRVWAFHGSLDETVSPEGMKTLAPALEAASDNFKYTEYEDATHATIYSLAANTPGFADFFFKSDAPTAIEAPETAEALGVEVDGSAITVTSNGPVALYNMQGMKVAYAAVDGAHTFSALPAGIYVVAAGSAAVKAIVR